MEKKIKRIAKHRQITSSLSFDKNLPIISKKKEIIQAISSHRVVIISGETGSGKTTQIPKFCLAAGKGIKGIIGCTQPRRIAATSVAKRIASELRVETGNEVGYKIRFSTKASPDSFIKIMTDGILLAEAQNDLLLSAYDTIIVDEAHERSANIDFILGILKTLLQKRSDLSVIITSATIDTQKFSRSFFNAPVIEVSGKLFPVETIYIDRTFGEEDEFLTYTEEAVSCVEKILYDLPRGDILIFMPTEKDIKETAELLNRKIQKRCTVMPLFARLGSKEQSEIFDKSPYPKIIVATNIAETSITVPGIKYVVDTGLARISKYNPGTGTTSLPIAKISKSSADQRKGRCGRTADGVCFRLYTQSDYNSRPDFSLPEILRSGLADVILRMVSLNLGDINEFPFMDKPRAKSIQDGFSLLEELGAIKRNKEKVRMTKHGKIMTKLPLDPRISKIIIEAMRQDCLAEIMIIAAALSIMDPRERPAEQAKKADAAHKKFADQYSDFITFINIWKNFHLSFENCKTKSQKRKAAKKFCRENFLSIKRMMEWQDVHRQIKSILAQNRLIVKKADDVKSENKKFSLMYTKIHKAFLSGFLSNIAVKKEKNIFNAAKNKQVMIFPGSGLFNKPPQWMAAAEVVKTSRNFARTVAAIDNAWIEPLAKDRCTYSYLHPHWEKNRGEVTAYEQVSLYGLIITSRRKVSYGRVDPGHASEIFIKDALVTGEIKKPFAFLKHNINLVEKIADMEDKLRTRDILADEYELCRFYQRLEGVFSVPTLLREIKKKKSDAFLYMKKEDIIINDPGRDRLLLFPDKISFGTKRLKCSYKFDPKQKDDGVTVNIPLNHVDSIAANSVDWVVPGLLEEKICAMIKALPKNHRKKISPAAQYSKIIAKELKKQDKPMATALSQFVEKKFKAAIPASEWQTDMLPEHLRMRISIRDEKGKEIIAGREKSLLNQSQKCFGNKEFEEAKKRWQKQKNKKLYTFWEFDDLKDETKIKSPSGAQWTVFPALCPRGKDKPGVALHLFEKKEEAIKNHKKGVAELYKTAFSYDLKFLRKNLVLPKNTNSFLQLALKVFGGEKAFRNNLYESLIKELFYKNIRTQRAFFQHMENIRPVIPGAGNKKLNAGMSLLSTLGEAVSVISHLKSKNAARIAVKDFLCDIEKELFKTAPKNFLILYDIEKIPHIIRYIKTIILRAVRGVENYPKYILKYKKVQKYEYILLSLTKDITNFTTGEKRLEIENFFWLLEEFKVSVFAQELKTPFPVSEKKLDRLLEKIRTMV